MPLILIGVDIDFTITQWNRKAEIVTGCLKGNALGKSLFSVMPRLGILEAIISESIKSGKIKQEHKRSFNRIESLIYEDITIYPLAGDERQGAVILIEDISDKVHMEEMLVQSEKMLSVGGLAAGMAHEINNPLAGIIQTAGVMSNRLNERMDHPANIEAASKAGTTVESIRMFMNYRKIPEMLQNIKDSGQRISNIVNNILSFARKSTNQEEKQNINELLDKTIELATTDYNLEKQYDFKNIKIIRKYDKGLPDIFCDPGKIQQVFLNLFRNGAFAMQKVKAKNPQFILRTRFHTNKNMVCIEIEDNGPGMNSETIKRIFDPFFTTKTVAEGTGLGLSLSYFIIQENHDGKLSVESEPGKGAKFIIELPVVTIN